VPSLWRNRSFTLLWGGQTLSELGSGMSGLAVPLVVLAITGSAVQAGVVGTVGSACRFVVRLPAGALADRVNRRRALLVADGVRLVAATVFAVLVLTHHATLAGILAITVVVAVAGETFSIVESSALRSIVALEQLPTASARNEARSAAAGLAGPPLGGVLYTVARALPFVANAVSFVVSLVCIAFIRTPLQQEREPDPAGSGGIREGIRFVLGQPVLRAVLYIAVPLNFGYNGLLFGVILMLQRAGVTPGLIGTVDTIVGIAGVAGAIAAPTLQRLLPIRVLVLGIAWTAAVLIACGTFLTHSPLIAVPIALSLLFSPAANAVLFGYQAAITPDRLQGRVISVIFFAALSFATVAPYVAGLLVTHVGGPGTVLVFAAVFAAAAVGATVSRGIRSMRPLAELARQVSTEPAVEPVGR
jgi:MFS family permease